MRNGYSFAAARHNPEGSRGGAPSQGKQLDAEAIQGIIQRAVIRLIEIVDQETAALRNHAAIDLKEFNNRKAHGLLELDRAMGTVNGVSLDAPTLGLLDALREKLDANSHVLAMHIEAVREIAAVIADAIREADSDGTYTHSYRSKG